VISFQSTTVTLPGVHCISNLTLVYFSDPILIYDEPTLFSYGTHFEVGLTYFLKLFTNRRISESVKPRMFLEMVVLPPAVVDEDTDTGVWSLLLPAPPLAPLVLERPDPASGLTVPSSQ